MQRDGRRPVGGLTTGRGMPPQRAPVQDRDVASFAAMTGNAVHADTK